MRERFDGTVIENLLRSENFLWLESHNGRFNRYYVRENEKWNLFAKNNSKDPTYILCNEYEDKYLEKARKGG